MDTLHALQTIFARHKDERICVLGTTCCGKSTLQKQLPGTVDMDEALWPQLTPKEEAFITRKPWTAEIGAFTRKLVTERIKVQAGQPLFSLILLDCEVIVYLDICDELLAEHCAKRGAVFADAKNVKDAIERTLKRARVQGGRLIYSLEIME